MSGGGGGGGGRLPETLPRPGRARRRLLMLLLLLLLSLPSAQPRSAPRTPLAMRPHGGGLHKKLAPNVFLGKAVKLELAEKQPEGPPNRQRPHHHALLFHRGRLAPQGHGYVTQRWKRHAAGHLRHAQLMRVGCVLGTCQVQNLSHRLWQLKGQPGRHDSSPMDPNSPHSYG